MQKLKINYWSLDSKRVENQSANQESANQKMPSMGRLVMRLGKWDLDLLNKKWKPEQFLEKVRWPARKNQLTFHHEKRQRLPKRVRDQVQEVSSWRNQREWLARILQQIFWQAGQRQQGCFCAAEKSLKKPFDRREKPDRIFPRWSWKARTTTRLKLRILGKRSVPSAAT